jgi:pilus assembly protein CpaB
MSFRNMGRSLLQPNSILLCIALLAGTGGATFARSYLQGRALATEKELSHRYQPRAVVVASRDIDAGETLNQQSLALREIPRDFIPGGALSAAEAALVLGKRSAMRLRRGDPMTVSSVLTHEASLAALVPAGRRAFTLSVDDVNAHAGLLQAGDRIDLYYSVGQGENGSSLSLLLEQVPVLATGAVLARGAAFHSAAVEEPGSFGSITLLVTADEAARLVLAERTGTLTVVLRAANDTAVTVLNTRNSQMLLRSPDSGRRNAGARSERVEVLLGGDGNSEPRRMFLAVGPSPADLQVVAP